MIVSGLGVRCVGVFRWCSVGIGGGLFVWGVGMVDWPVWGEAAKRLEGMVYSDWMNTNEDADLRAAERALRAVWACPTCKGEGKTYRKSNSSIPTITYEYECPSCGGSGLQTEWECAGDLEAEACRQYRVMADRVLRPEAVRSHTGCGPVVKIRLEQS